MSVMLTITAEAIILNETLYSMEEPQVLDYAAGGMPESLTVSIEVVQNMNESQYYILSLDSSRGIELPMTAIPVILDDCTGTIA